MVHWRDETNELKPFLNKIIEETHKYNFKKAENKAKAQLWIAIAILAKQLYDIEIKLKYLERALQDIGKKGKDEPSKIQQKMQKDSKEVERIFKDFVRGKFKKKVKSKNVKKSSRKE